MNIDVRKYIINNFKDDDINEVKKAINTSIASHDEDPLIGMGVLLELAWTNSDDAFKEQMLNNIQKGLH